MKNKAQNCKLDLNTEEKIKEAAREVFMQKGYAATRTRDIAEQAGINHALLNYYFRSKDKLFELIMWETLTHFFEGVIETLNDASTSFEDKIELLVGRYTDQLTQTPDLPIFILSEIRNNPPDQLVKKFPFKQLLEDSIFFKQHREAVSGNKISEPNPLHFLLNMLGLIAFPFIARPMIMSGKNLKKEEFDELIQERRKMIPIWISAMMKTS